MYMQALLGPGTLGVQIEFLHLTSDSITLPVFLSLTRRLNVPVISFLPRNRREMSHRMLVGTGGGLGVVGAYS